MKRKAKTAVNTLCYYATSKIDAVLSPKLIRSRYHVLYTIVDVSQSSLTIVQSFSRYGVETPNVMTVIHAESKGEKESV